MSELIDQILKQMYCSHQEACILLAGECGVDEDGFETALSFEHYLLDFYELDKGMIQPEYRKSIQLNDLGELDVISCIQTAFDQGCPLKEQVLASLGDNRSYSEGSYMLELQKKSRTLAVWSFYEAMQFLLPHAYHSADPLTKDMIDLQEAIIRAIVAGKIETVRPFDPQDTRQLDLLKEVPFLKQKKWSLQPESLIKWLNAQGFKIPEYLSDVISDRLKVSVKIDRASSKRYVAIREEIKNAFLTLRQKGKRPSAKQVLLYLDDHQDVIEVIDRIEGDTIYWFNQRGRVSKYEFSSLEDYCSEVAKKFSS